MRIAIAQLDFTVGDIDANCRLILKAARSAQRDQGVNLLVCPELALTGYPPEDLLFRADFMRKVDVAIATLCAELPDLAVLVGAPVYEQGRLLNAALFIEGGEVRGRYFKQCLPNYGVFDEARYFEPGTEPLVIDLAGVKLGVSICEDAWCPGPLAAAAQAGAHLLVNLNASPYDRQKSAQRLATMRERVAETALPMIYANLLGGQDELVFDGASFVLDGNGERVLQAPGFEEGVYCVDIATDNAARPIAIANGSCFSDYRSDLVASVYQALVLGVRDYVSKNGFRGGILGLSGGIDSALTLAIAVDALGADHVEAVMMPSVYTAGMSLEDAEKQARRLGVSYRVIPIKQPVDAFSAVLADAFDGMQADVTEENIQARSRGLILMALSNKLGSLLLTTGNKSEMAVGYATLYGDMAGGFAPLKDCPKTLVYQLARYRNESAEVIPKRVIERPPSAELRPDQKDSDSLPDYDLLDALLERFVEQDASVEGLIAEGFDADTVRRVARLVLLNEYKRRQAPPGVRVSARAFGRDRRYPITSGYRG